MTANKAYRAMSKTPPGQWSSYSKHDSMHIGCPLSGIGRGAQQGGARLVAQCGRKRNDVVEVGDDATE